MAQNGTNDRVSIERQLPTTLAVSSARPSLAASGPEPEFLSQMIAERDRLAPQRARRRAPVRVALSAYSEGVSRGEPRLPGGAYASLTI